MAKRPTAPISAGERADMPIVCPPERQDSARSAYLLGYLCRLAVLFAAVFGLALFVCDAFLLTEAHNGPLSVSTLLLMTAAAVIYFAMLSSGWIGRAAALGLTAVGLVFLCRGTDVKQSIYQFRLADPGIFLEKYHHYQSAEEAKPGQGRKVLLSHNFRSGGEVIEGVNDVFRTCMRPEVGGLFRAVGIFIPLALA